MNVELMPRKIELASAIKEADIRVLLMVLFHTTGDQRWLEAPYRPRRDIRLIPDPQAGLPLSVQQEVRNAVLALFASGTPKPVITDPGDALMQEMMSVCLGEDVPPEYAPLIREEMAIVERGVKWMKAPSEAELDSRHVLIVGAGVCGLALGVALGRLGIPYTIIEKNCELGGTWHVNRYPGCGVDTPNHSYSYSFGGNHPWTRYFSRREEIHAYLAKIADDFQVRCNIRFNTRLTGSRWDEKNWRWVSTLQSEAGSTTLESAFLVSAVGQLSDPSVPRIAGAEDYEGEVFHSAKWPDGVSLAGRKVAVIGTGATAMQLMPTIADEVASVAVYQRSPQWARPIPGYGDTIGEGTRWLLKHLPFYAEWFRFNMFWRYGDGLLQFLRKDPDWPHPHRSVNRVNDRHRQELVDFIHSELGDRTDLIAKCVPSYPPYGKRILLDNGWYRALLKENVELVDTPVDHIASGGIVTSDGRERPADVIVYATGFKVSEMAAQLGIRGRDGLDLAEAWEDENPTAYLGLSVPGFPNFFSMLGPNSGPAHGGSVIFQAECQTRYITSSMVEMIENSIAAIDIRPDVHDDYLVKVDAEHEQLIWTHKGMSTYYRNKHGRVFSVMPWRFVDYWAMTHDSDLSLYELTPAAQP